MLFDYLMLWGSNSALCCFDDAQSQWRSRNFGFAFVFTAGLSAAVPRAPGKDGSLWGHFSCPVGTQSGIGSIGPEFFSCWFLLFGLFESKTWWRQACCCRFSQQTFSLTQDSNQDEGESWSFSLWARGAMFLLIYHFTGVLGDPPSVKELVSPSCLGTNAQVPGSLSLAVPSSLPTLATSAASAQLLLLWFPVPSGWGPCWFPFISCKPCHAMKRKLVIADLAFLDILWWGGFFRPSCLLPFVLFKLWDKEEKYIWLGGSRGLREDECWRLRGWGEGAQQVQKQRQEVTLQVWRKACNSLFTAVCVGRGSEVGTGHWAAGGVSQHGLPWSGAFFQEV